MSLWVCFWLLSSLKAARCKCSRPPSKSYLEDDRGLLAWVPLSLYAIDPLAAGSKANQEYQLGTHVNKSSTFTGVRLLVTMVRVDLVLLTWWFYKVEKTCGVTWNWMQNQQGHRHSRLEAAEFVKLWSYLVNRCLG